MQSFPPASLDHELAGEVGRRRGFQKLQLDGLVEWVTGQKRPVVEGLEAEGLPGGVDSTNIRIY